MTDVELFKMAHPELFKMADELLTAENDNERLRAEVARLTAERESAMLAGLKAEQAFYAEREAHAQTRAQARSMADGIMRCIDASWQAYKGRDWSRPELVLAEYLDELREAHAETRSELAKVDAAFGNRTALDGCQTRVEKILRCIKSAAVADPGAQQVKAMRAEARAERAEAVLLGLRAWAVSPEGQSAMLPGHEDAVLAKLDELARS